MESIIHLYLHEPYICLVDAAACVSFNIFTIYIAARNLHALSAVQARAYLPCSMYAYALCTLMHLLRGCIEIGPTQTSEGKERFPAR